jgi:hypothetical protein
MNPDNTPTPTWKVCKEFNSALLEDEKEGERLNEIHCASSDEAECLVDLLNKKEREVARLMEELRGEIAWRRTKESELEKLHEDLTRPAPEEPANPTCSNTTHKFSHCDCKQPSEKDTSTETCPSQKDTEWRELGPDETIQEGDQVQPKHHNRKGAWIWIWSHEVGATPRDQEAMRYRTRRPLPKQEEMPLEKELKIIGNMTNIYREESGAIVSCLRYLRDEIQKLNGK